MENIIGDNERVRAAFTSPDGLRRIAAESERNVSFPVVMIATDSRILFVAGEQTGGDFGADAGSLAYADLAAVAIEGADPATLTLSMADGVRWEVPLPDADPGRVDSLARHLQWVGHVRSRLVACRNDLDLTAGQIRDHAAEMEWDDAEAVYADQREALDGLVGAVQRTTPIDDAVLAPELTEMDRTLERAYARLSIERAESQLELGQQLIENEDYSQARKVLQTAQQYYERASGRADEIERSDTFRFGEQRELLEDIDRLEWEIEAVAAEPIRRAHEAKIKATNATETGATADHWETAFRRYGNVLTLDWGSDGRSFAGDPDEIQAEMRAAADRLVDVHSTLAREKWNEGVTLERNGDVKNGLRACNDAIEHIDRAAELAVEFRPEDASAIEQRRDGMKSLRERLRETGEANSGDTTTADSGTDASTADADSETESEQSPREAPDLVDIDTHQEITFDAVVTESTVDAGDDQQSDVDTEERTAKRDEDGNEDTTDSSGTVLHSDGTE
ncbi:hypothetical protein [Salinibaculum rarum]|uniref:hypothetical protein n=1 Tax=Salinibaculum rarum TaxID=3058903 RepID=UPI00265F50E7|nr:hypothetical protein [Salinibaculum sp. KK48]